MSFSIPTAARAGHTCAGRIRRLLLSVVLAVCLAFGATTAMSRQAEAASFVTGCFVSNKGGYNLQGVQVQLQAWSYGQWVTIATQTLGLQGCASWNIGSAHRGSYLTMLVNYHYSGGWWFGQTPLMANPGNQMVSLNAGIVTCYGCP